MMHGDDTVWVCGVIISTHKLAHKRALSQLPRLLSDALRGAELVCG